MHLAISSFDDVKRLHSNDLDPLFLHHGALDFNLLAHVFNQCIAFFRIGNVEDIPFIVQNCELPIPGKNKQE